jgi:hypothetical protein
MAFAETLCKYLLTFCLLAMGVLSFYKDKLPEPAFYDLAALAEPRQAETDRQPFKSQAGGQEYAITPLYDYELHGVVVSYHNADSFTDIWHHTRWLDFLKERDVCVIWGDNVASGVYKAVEFSSDSWTCWFSWKDSSINGRFKPDAVSNNHLLVDDAVVRDALMQSELGDHVRLKGQLAEYANPANGFRRGTSTIRTDTGNGACETVYVTDFEIVKKANPGLRKLYKAMKWLAVISGVGFLILFFIVPYQVRY